MKILVIHAHTANRGDEAAVKAMVDEILLVAPDSQITISINGSTFYPKMDPRVKQINRVPVPHSMIGKLDFYIMCMTKGKLALIKKHKEFIEEIKTSDLVLHAPGGPSLGDIYIQNEILYLKRLKLVKDLGIKYMFYAPSMGPFKTKKHEKKRKLVLRSAEKIYLRDPISMEYLKGFIRDIDVELALDSALQHDIDLEKNAEILDSYTELSSFIQRHDKCIGITITDLKWHPAYKESGIDLTIKSVFNKFIRSRIDEGYGIVFIPQLYGKGNDTTLMKEFCMDQTHCMVIDANSEQFDTYFQQYVISKLYAVVGMRYHSNIFSAKMGIPFVSVSYEQKMLGFMNKIGLEHNCIKVKELSAEKLEQTFLDLILHYSETRRELESKHEWMKSESGKTTKAVFEILKETSGKNRG